MLTGLHLGKNQSSVISSLCGHDDPRSNSGNNTLNASGLESTLVQGFAGNDTITLARVDDDAQGGDGNDTIGLTKTGTHSNDVTGGAGNDSITFLSASVFEVTVGGGAGNDLITLGGGADASTVTDVQIRANEGNDTIVFNTAAALRTINQSYVGLGQGNDTIIFGATNVLGASDVFGGKGRTPSFSAVLTVPTPPSMAVMALTAEPEFSNPHQRENRCW